jgi:hypothetical protein
VTVAECVGFVVTVPILIGCAVIAPHVRGLHPAHASATLTTPAPIRMHVQFGAMPTVPKAVSQREDRDSAGEVDLFGNEVTDAVAKYKLDSAGSLYELHSPQTELPRLGSPKS